MSYRRSKPAVCFFAYTVHSKKPCLLCPLQKTWTKFIVVPTEARFKVYLCHNLFIPAGSRCCPSHFTNNLLDLTSLEMKNCTKDHSFVNRATIIELLKLLRDEANIKRKTLLDFNDPESMTNDGYVTLTGLKKCDFDDILTCVSSADVRPSRSRSIKTCIAVLLTKLRTSLDNKLLALLFNMSKPQIRRAVTTARQALCNSFVLHAFGIQAFDQRHSYPKATETTRKRTFLSK